MLTRFKNQYRPIMLIKGGHNIYCIVSEPCITRFLPAFTVKLDPGERLCATFSTHSPPGAWSIMMAAAAGRQPLCDDLLRCHPGAGRSGGKQAQRCSARDPARRSHDGFSTATLAGNEGRQRNRTSRCSARSDCSP